MINPNPNFWYGKRVLLTGHTGFKGAWLAMWLHRLGANVTGISLEPQTSPSLFSLLDLDDIMSSHIQNICDAAATARILKQTEPEVIFHLAAQPLVRASYKEPLGTFATNIQGTANLLDGIRGLDKAKVLVAITTDKVYRDVDQVFPYRETDPLGGCDPYSASKAAAELVIASYRDSFLSGEGVAVATARAGNVIGGGDWSEDRLIPDAVRAWGNGKPLVVRHPQSVRPWQHVLEPLLGYLSLAENLWRNPQLAGSYNFGPHTHEAASVREVIEIVREAYQESAVMYAEHENGPHEAAWLTLEVAKARETLGISPRWNLKKSIDHTIEWYRRQARGEAATDLCHYDISAFEATSVETVASEVTASA